MIKRPIDWTDEELKKAGWVSEHGIGPYGQAVRAFLTALGAVHPAEAREREREAADAYASCNWPVGDARVAAIRRAIDRDYPSLLPKSPPPLVLSSGIWTRDKNGVWRSDINPFQTTPELLNVSDGQRYVLWLEEYGSEEEKR